MPDLEILLRVTLDNFCKELCTFAQIAPRGHCLDMPVEINLAAADSLHRTLWKLPAVQDLLIHIEYSLKIHWVRLRPLPQCERNLGYTYLGPDRPGQPRLDSGSLPAGWFPLPDAVRRLLGCHPSALPLSVFVDLRAALGHVGCCASAHAVTVVGDRRS